MEKELRAIVPADLDRVDQADFTPAEKELVIDFFERMRFTPLHALILACKRENCVNARKCPFVKIGKLPKYGEDCYVESALIKIWTEQLVNELEIEPTNIVDQAQVREIVALNIFENRAYMGYLSQDDQVTEVVRNIAFDGREIRELTVHPLLKQVLENQKLKDKIRADLLSTREAKSKTKMVKEDGVLAKFAKMMEDRKLEIEGKKKELEGK